MSARFVLRAAIAVSGLLLAFAGARLVALDVEARPVLHAAKRLESGLRPGPETIDALRLVLSERRPLACRRDVGRAVLTADLAILDHGLRDAAGVALPQDYARTVADFRSHLACLPLDGNAWLRLAMVRLRFEGPTPAVYDMARLSQWLVPYDAWVMEGRVPFLVGLSQGGDAVAGALLEREVAALLRYGAPHFVRRIGQGMGDYGRARLRDGLAGVDPERAAVLARALGFETQ